MKLPVLAMCVAAALAAQAQTASKAGTTARRRPAHSHASSVSAIKLPPGIPPAHGILKTAVALRYQDIVVGAGPVGEENKIWHVKYTGWRASDGVKFDSWDEHRRPVIKDGKPEMGNDGKPVLGDPEPLAFPHGVGRMIPGFDVGIDGMRVGGKRRIFVPWQLAYGNRSIPEHGPEHPGIPAKSDLIFDVELLEVTDIPQRPSTMPVAPPAPHFPHPGATPATSPSVEQKPTPPTPPPAAKPETPQPK